jgi:hypothetical protein
MCATNHSQGEYNMNKDNHWHDLIQKHLAGMATQEESTALERALETDSNLRSLYLDYANLDMALGSSAEAAKALQNAQVIPSSSRIKESKPVKRSLRPLTTAVAGVLIGVLSSSVVWAYAVSQAPELPRVPVPLVDSGFENLNSPVASVLPRTLNRWNGDASHVVSSGSSGVEPKEGKSMLQMLEVEHRKWSRIEQIVDVSHLVPDQGGAVEFSASALCDRALERSKMILVLRAFTMSGEEINGSTQELDDQVTSSARKAVFIPAGSTKWHTTNLRMDLPPNTKTLVFSIAAVNLPERSKGTARYIDDIKATIISQTPSFATQQ